MESSRIALLNQSAVVAAMTSLADAIHSVRAPPWYNASDSAPHPT
jgi:chloramphenicol 3-O-phosphotransferase